jgi:guanosine-3',5'-bis(diphosphate) 3'-pyrophosphohydrolase
MRTLEEEIENKEIVKRYRQLLRISLDTRQSGDITEIRKAFRLAVKAHSNMRRKSGEPYIYHPIAVARIAAEEIGLGTTSIVCALLHDVVEDSDYTLDYIRKEFGDKVANIIDGLTKISGIFDQSKSPQAENFRRMLLTLSDDVRVILIKLCDRLHNMRTLNHMSAKNQLKISSETMYLYAPLAHRLGLYAIKTELEDLALKYTEPNVYKDIKDKLNATREQRKRYIRSFIKPIKMELDNIGIQAEIKGRPKSIYSILNKMRKQRVEFEQVYDLFAIRIIVDPEPAKEQVVCWNVYSIITNIFKPNPDRLRDWISTPKSNGYESLHTTVMGPKGKWVEVQIRSIRMDEIAERGYAAHWKYKHKEDGKTTDALDNWLNRVRGILESPEGHAVDFVDVFKSNFFSDEVFVFTPQGDLKKLPMGSTIMDFAFEIHTEIGSKCIGGKVNGKLVPISQKLSNGDQVEIITSGKQKPKADWLKFVVTGKAKGKINQLIKEERRKASQEGKEILIRKFRNSKLPMNSDNLRALCNYFKLQSEADLFEAVAKEKLPPNHPSYKEIVEDYKEKKSIQRKPASGPKEKDKKPTELIIGDSDDVQLDYTFAKCCSPIPGDEVVGFITIGEGVKIHRTNCKNAIRLMSNYGYRIIKARWAGYPLHNHSFEASLEIRGADSVGLVSKITDVISKELKVNMKSISFSAEDGTFIGHVILEVDGREHLNNLIQEIKNVDEYITVIRTDI